MKKGTCRAQTVMDIAVNPAMAATRADILKNGMGEMAISIGGNGIFTPGKKSQGRPLANSWKI